MVCANLKGARCIFDLFLQKSSNSFSNCSPQDLTNTYRSYSTVFVPGDESARGIAFQQRWMVSDLKQISFFLKILPSVLKFLEQRILRYSSASLPDGPAISASSGCFSFSPSRTSGVRLSKPVELSLSKSLIAADNFPWNTSFAKTLNMSSTALAFFCLIGRKNKRTFGWTQKYFLCPIREKLIRMSRGTGLLRVASPGTSSGSPGSLLRRGSR